MIAACESCDFETDLKTYRSYGAKAEVIEHRYCNLCASTMTSSLTHYPGAASQSDTVKIMQTICYVGNAIIQAIETYAR